ncbi:MAG: HEAT repeat domain-containing protein [Verrucomicrobiia bacterium]
MKSKIIIGIARIIVGLALICPGICAEVNKKGEQKKLLDIIQTSTNLHEKVVACKRLAVIGDQESIPALSKLLEDPQMHHMARFALEPNPSPLVDEVFRSALGKLQGKLLIGVINSIGVRRDAAATPQLVNLLKSSEPEVAGAAGAALGRIGTPEAAKALKKAISSAQGALKEDLVCSAILCGERLYSSGKNSDAVQLLDFVRNSDIPRHLKMAATRGAILARGDDGLSLLIDQLKSDDDGMFAVGLRVAREFNSPKTTSALIDLYSKIAASSKQNVYRLSALLEAIGDRKDPAVAPLAIKVLTDDRTLPTLQLSAIKVISKIGDESAVPALLKVAAKGNTDAAKAAYNCLITIGGKDAESAIANAIKIGGDEEKIVAIKIASERNIQSAIPVLLISANSQNKTIRMAAITAVGAIGEQSHLKDMIDILVRSTDKEELNAAESAVSAICDRSTNKDAAANILIDRYSNATTDAKCSILRLLVQTPSDKALQIVKQGLSDPNSAVSETAARSLSQWQSVNGLKDMIELASTTKNPTIKVLALRGFVRLIDQGEIAAEQRSEYLRKAMTLAERDDEKRLVLAAAGNCPTIDSLKLATEFIANQSLKDEAAAAIISVSQKIVSKHPDEVKDAIQKILNEKFDQLTHKKAQEILNKIKK